MSDECADGLDVMFHNIALLATSGKASLLMSRLVPRFVKSIVKKYRQRGYTSRHLHCKVVPISLRLVMLACNPGKLQLNRQNESVSVLQP